MICPNCREDNAPTFRFCGMCGTPLEPRRQTGAPALDPMSAFPPPAAARVVGADPLVRPADTPIAPGNEARTANKVVPPISGPSLLGLDQGVGKQPVGSPSRAMFEPDPLNGQKASEDLLRERAFSGSFGSFLEPEEPKTGGRRLFLLVVLLAGLGVAGWWTYTNYLRLSDKGPASTVSPDTAPTETPAKPTESPVAPNSTPATQTPSAAPSENATGASGNDVQRPVAETKPAQTAPKEPAPIVSKPEKRPAPLARTAKAPEPVAADTGDAAFRKGEAYLYGRGVPENCDEAVKNLKAASAKSNAKARSAFGTMYATGHCVPRDLPTSYTWFALALRADPNNQILEKDLSAIWNQMTPPERQMATRVKQ